MLIQLFLSLQLKNIVFLQFLRIDFSLLQRVRTTQLVDQFTSFLFAIVHLGNEKRCQK